MVPASDVSWRPTVLRALGQAGEGSSRPPQGETHARKGQCFIRRWPCWMPWSGATLELRIRGRLRLGHQGDLRGGGRGVFRLKDPCSPGWPSSLCEVTVLWGTGHPYLWTGSCLGWDPGFPAHSVVQKAQGWADAKHWSRLHAPRVRSWDKASLRSAGVLLTLCSA